MEIKVLDRPSFDAISIFYPSICDALNGHTLLFDANLDYMKGNDKVK